MSIFVKDIYIQVPEYNFSCDTEKDDKFIGREENLKNLKRRIAPPTNNNEKKLPYKGAYLVTGYRGMGKTTLVNKVVETTNKNNVKNKIKIENIKINLSQDQLSDYDLLKQLFISLNSTLKQIINNKFRVSNISTPTSAIIILGILTYIALTFWEFHGYIFHEPFINNTIILFIIAIVYITSVLLFKKIINSTINKCYQNRDVILSKINEIEKRINSGLEINKNNNSANSQENNSPLDSILSLLNNNESGPIYKQTFEKLTTKELEFEITSVLELYHKYNQKQHKKRYILFTIDELDKLESEFDDDKLDSIDFGKSKIQSRKETISKLLANLKGFIHTAKAKFVFIGGAEMYDASLADIADRESFYGSIFHEVIYLNSFFQDFVGNKKKGLNQMTETYLTRLLNPNKLDKTNKDFDLAEYYKLLKHHNIESRKDIIYHLHRFIIYLTYRSNGSPKKLKEFIEYYLVEKENDTESGKPKLVVYISQEVDDKTESVVDVKPEIEANKNKFQWLPSFWSETKIKEETKLKLLPSFWKQPKYKLILRESKALKKGVFLRLQYRQQHKIGLLTSIILPYLTNNQTHLKIFNDKNLYLSAFLIDHILKFHKSAFSWRELELIPDIIIGGKGPNLRNTLMDLISYLSVKHIRETTNAMFEYKFRGRSAMELKYISKVSDESAAAFNFTFDESYHLKTFFKKKLKQKTDAYKNDKSISNDSFIETISNLNSTIAIIHYYDEEYDSAIRYYTDSIQPIRDLKQNGSTLNAHQKILYIKNRLLLSLCLEKIHNYDSAYTVIRSSILDSKKWKFDTTESSQNPELPVMQNAELSWEEPFKRMQLFLRPYLSLLMIIEKKRSDGITFSNLRKNIDEYSKFMGLVDLFPFKPFNKSIGYGEVFKGNINGDNKRVETLLADYYQNVGSLLFFKNRNYKSLHDEGALHIWKSFLNIEPLKSVENRVREVVENINYLSLDNIRKSMEVRVGADKHTLEKKRFYFPSFSASFYYITSLRHIINPYEENIISIFNNTNSNTFHHTPVIIEKLLFNNNSRHVLNGKQKKLLGLITSKLADTILSCIGTIRISERQLEIGTGKKDEEDFGTLENLTHEFWGLYVSEKKQEKSTSIPFESFFSIQSVFYMCLLSSRAYLLSGSYYDSLFSLKKCLYIIKTHFDKLIYVNTEENKSDLTFIENFVQLIKLKSEKIIEKFLQEDSVEDRHNIRVIMNKKNDDYSKEENYNLNKEIRSVDSEEIYFLIKTIEFKIEQEKETLKIETFIDELNKESNFLNNIFTRIQKLRYNSFIRHKLINVLINPDMRRPFYGEKFNINVTNENDVLTYSIPTNEEEKEIKLTEEQLKEIIVSVFEMNLCFKNLINIIKTYGNTYIMSYSYMASLYMNIYNFYDTAKFLQEILKQIKENTKRDYKKDYPQYEEFWSFDNQNSYRTKAIDYFYKTIGLHSEGAEYKAIIKDMYMLEDDFNDSLVHFCAALERSLINTGVIESKLAKLEVTTNI